MRVKGRPVLPRYSAEACFGHGVLRKSVIKKRAHFPLLFIILWYNDILSQDFFALMGQKCSKRRNNDDEWIEVEGDTRPTPRDPVEFPPVASSTGR